MKFFTQIALACFSVGVLANVTPRHLNDFDNVLVEVQENIDVLNVAVNAFNADTSPVQQASTKLVDCMSRGNNELSVKTALNLPDTVALGSQVTVLITHAKILVASLKIKLSVVIAAGKCGLVRENIHAINTAAGTLMGTVLSKCNPLALEIAKKQAKTLQDALDGCKEDYNTSNCP